MKSISLKRWQEVYVSGFVRLFKYIIKVSEEIGEEGAWRILENNIIEKRLNWFEENKDNLNPKETPVEQAYNFFYLNYLRLDPKDGKIIEKSKEKIKVRWRNFCPVLEACKIIGLDTRKICKKVWEKPCQVFLSRINPNLKFKRNYNKIRPYVDYCEETIELSD